MFVSTLSKKGLTNWLEFIWTVFLIVVFSFFSDCALSYGIASMGESNLI